jgi:hypothetical protein
VVPSARMVQPYRPLPTRAERRATAREAARLLMRQQAQPRGFRWDYTLALAVAVIAVIQVFVPPQTPRTALFWLVATFGMGIYPVLQIAEWGVGREGSWIVRGVALAVWSVAMGVFGFRVWPAIPYYHKFAKEELTQFSSTVSNPPSDAEQLRIGCPQSSEDLCITAGQFLPLFQRAGWKVEGNSIQRLILPKPISGVVIFRHGQGTPVPSNPDPISALLLPARLRTAALPLTVPRLIHLVAAGTRRWCTSCHQLFAP